MRYNFDRVSDQYDASRQLPADVAERICRWVLDRLPTEPTIAEIGVGTGRIAIPFIRAGVRYTGFDISEQMTQRLREKLGGDLQRAELHLADITEPLPVESQSQDAVIAVHILHLVDAQRALTQVRRILKQHGVLIWGFQLHDDLCARQRIREYFKQAAAGLGGTALRDFHAQPGRELLAAWGAESSRHTVATWTEEESCRSVLDGLRNRLMSFTWEMSDGVMAPALAQTEQWATAEYGDLAEPHPVQQQFLMDWYQF